MENRAIRLLLLAIAMELFALVMGFTFSSFAGLYLLGRLVAFVFGITGLVVALRGYRARE